MYQKKSKQKNSPAYLMSKNSSHNDIIIARQNTSNITSFFPLTHLYVIWSQVHSMPTKQVKPCLKGNPCPHGWLSKDHRHSFTFKWEICPLP
uniref:Putative ovule protein n=1 Tax=Solanum chacoense TaxID=4108 RepID=A0A0V0H3N4_SOLCH